MIYYIIEITIDSFKFKKDIACAPHWFVTKDLVDIHTRLQQEMQVLDLDNFTVYPVRVEPEWDLLQDEPKVKPPLFYCSSGELRDIVRYVPDNVDFSQMLQFNEQTGLAKLVSI